MSPGKMNWVTAILRHFTTIVVILGGLWWLATPRVEAFIMKTVNNRITAIEQTLVDHGEMLNEILRTVKDGLNER